jgi:CBS domain-containing protein
MIGLSANADGRMIPATTQSNHRFRGAARIGTPPENEERTMIVANILKTKGSHVVSVAPTDTIVEVCSILIREGIGAAVVRDAAGRVVGLLGERDIVRAVARNGEAALQFTAESVMMRDVTFCAPSDTVETVMQRMTDRRVRHLPAIERGQLMGIVSIGDVVKHRLAESELEAEALRKYIATG